MKTGYFAAAWSFVFATLHVIWACGWYIGLNPETADKAFQKRWFLVYDLAVAELCLVAMFLGLALAQPRERRRRYRRVVVAMSYAAAAILTLRGVAGLSQAAYILASGRNIIVRLAAWDLWFCLGGMLFALALSRFRRIPGAIFFWAHEFSFDRKDRRNSMKIAITGSHGMIGSALAPLLEGAGHEVVRLGRWPYSPEMLAGANAVIHLAGENIGSRRWTPASAPP